MQNYVEMFEAVATKATYGQIEQAAKWYLDAERVAEEVARNLDADLEVGASVVSAFSPRERWTNNVEKAVSFSLGKKVVGLPNNLKMAQKSLKLGFDALNGQKTNAFARAIAGDENAVVIDVWMLRALGIEKKSPTQLQYVEMAKAVKAVAAKFGTTPRTMQALIWIIVRGSAQQGLTLVEVHNTINYEASRSYNNMVIVGHPIFNIVDKEMRFMHRGMQTQGPSYILSQGPTVLAKTLNWPQIMVGPQITK